MTQHRYFTPAQAIDVFERAGFHDPIGRIVDFAEAGRIRGYAEYARRDPPSGQAQKVLQKAIDPWMWGRVVREGKCADVATGTVRLAGSVDFGGGSATTMIGIRFDELQVVEAARVHGRLPKPARPKFEPTATPVSTALSEPQKPKGKYQGTPVPLDKEWLTKPEAGSMARCESTKLHELINQGVMETIKRGGRTLISRASVQRYLDGAH